MPFDYTFMRDAYAAGIIVAVVAGVVGYFVVLRGLSFAGHALSHIGFAGATGAVALSGVSLFGLILNIPAIFGLLVFTVGSDWHGHPGQAHSWPRRGDWHCAGLDAGP